MKDFTTCPRSEYAKINWHVIKYRVVVFRQDKVQLCVFIAHVKQMINMK